MENAEEIFHFLEDFTKRKPKTIPQELNEYLAYVARTGDPVYQWALVKSLFKEKLLSVITDFYETTPGIEIPPYPNVDPFNYDIMKNSLLERLDSFTSAPFTVQRICELLTYPRKQYNRVDKYMRAIEKNILVVSTREPGIQRQPEPENGDPMEPIVNGSDNNSEYNVDVEMEDMSWKENVEQQISEPQPGSSDAHITVDDIEARIKTKEETPMDIQEKTISSFESVTPPETSISADEPPIEAESEPEVAVQKETVAEELKEDDTVSNTPEEQKPDVEMKQMNEPEVSTTLVIPEIKVDDAEMTEQRLSEQSPAEKIEEVKETQIEPNDKEPSPEPQPITETHLPTEVPSVTIDENSTDSSTKEDIENKLISEVSTSSEESSSSDNTDGNSDSPKTDERPVDVQEDSSQSDAPSEESVKEPETIEETIPSSKEEEKATPLESDNYSISDVNSELPQPPAEPKLDPIEEVKEPEKVEETVQENTETVESNEI